MSLLFGSFNKLKNWIAGNRAIKQVYPDYSIRYNPDDIFPEEFFTNLVRTINFTEMIVANISKEDLDYAHVLRTTNPLYNGSPFYHYDKDNVFTSQPDVAFNYLELLEKALEVRTETELRYPAAVSIGEVIEFVIDETVMDGASNAHSEGFVDVADIPPIDTWFYLTKTKLYCWIPCLFISKIEDALAVSVTEPYNWLKDSNPGLHELIKQELETTIPNR